MKRNGILNRDLAGRFAKLGHTDRIVIADCGLPIPEDLVTSLTANFDRGEGLTVMENMLQANPEIVAVFAQNDEMALGALEAIDASGKDIVVLGFDATDDALAKIEEGKLAASVAQKPEEIGKAAIKTAVSYLKGETVEEFVPVELELVK